MLSTHRLMNNIARRVQRSNLLRRGVISSSAQTQQVQHHHSSAAAVRERWKNTSHYGHDGPNNRKWKEQFAEKWKWKTPVCSLAIALGEKVMHSK